VIEDDWNRVVTAFLKLKEKSSYPQAFLFADIQDLRKTDNKGIDFAIRRLKTHPDYTMKIRLHGGPTGSYPRHPLRCYDPLFNMERHYYLIQIDKPIIVDTIQR